MNLDVHPCGLPVAIVAQATVDVVLVSNFKSILGLPYILEHPDFRGVVYATEPTLEFGHQLMRSMVAHSSRSYRPPSSVRLPWSLRLPCVRPCRV